MRDATEVRLRVISAVANVLSIQRAREIIFKLVGAVGMIGGTESVVAAMKQDDFTS
jgi:hypothetical protein